MISWTEAVREAVERRAAGSPNGVFSRADLIEHELNTLVAKIGSIGKTPEQTLSRELQELRDAGAIEFLDDKGTYRLVR